MASRSAAAGRWVAASRLASTVAVVLIVTGCNGRSESRDHAPSQDDLARAIRTTLTGVVPDRSTSQCLASEMLDSDLSDRVIWTFVDGGSNYTPTTDEMDELLNAMNDGWNACS